MKALFILLLGFSTVLGSDFNGVMRRAETGDAEAQALLGLMYDQGDGVPQDFSKAVLWYARAALQTNAIAQVGLSGAYYQEHGIAQNEAMADWITLKLANEGNAQMQLQAGLIFRLFTGSSG